MIYLSGSDNPDLRAVAMEWGIGLMLQPGNGYWPVVDRYPYYAVDNGCFAQGPKFQVESFLRWLEENGRPESRCLFAVAPDVWDNWAETWARSREVLPRLRSLGYRAAVVAQTGFDPATAPWDEFDCLFVGGPDSNHRSSRTHRAIVEAKRRGKWVHHGRVNSYPRLAASRALGYDSADGTFLKYAPEFNLKRVRRWLDRLHAQPDLFAGVGD